MKNQYSITFVRHAESILNSKGLFCGRIDCSITKEGKEKCKKLRNVEPFTEGFDVVFSSPLKRTHQTLDLILPGSKPIDDQRLIVVNYGDLEGTKTGDVSEELRKAYKVGLVTPPNGENFHDVEKRFFSFLNDIDRLYSNTNKRILVVTHGSILRAITHIRDKEIAQSSNNLDYHTYTQSDIKFFIKSYYEGCV